MRDQEYRQIILHIAGLRAAPNRAEPAHAGADAVNHAVNHPRIEKARKEIRHGRERPDDEKIIKLVDVIFVQQQAIGSAAKQCRKPLGQSNAAAIRQVSEQDA